MRKQKTSEIHRHCKHCKYKIYKYKFDMRCEIMWSRSLHLINKQRDSSIFFIFRFHFDRLEKETNFSCRLQLGWEVDRWRKMDEVPLYTFAILYFVQTQKNERTNELSNRFIEWLPNNWNLLFGRALASQLLHMPL